MEVTAAVFCHEDKVLLMRRGPGHSHAGGWEYPGGKIEPGETGEACIRRELREELGIDAQIGPMVAESTRVDGEQTIHLTAYRVRSYQGEITLTDHDRMEWIPVEGLTEHEQLPSDLDISRQVAEQFLAQAEVLTLLNGMAEPDYGAFQRKLLPTVPPELVLGVRTPALRTLAKQLYGTETGERFLRTLPHTYFDENQLHAFLLCRIRDFEECVAAVNQFLPDVDNWATCDQLSPAVFRRNPEALLPHVLRWVGSDAAYTVRFGVGMLMQHYLEQRFDPVYPELVANLHREDYYVRMMQAWYFATALAKQYDAVLPYLEQQRLETWVHNKTIQKAVESYRITPEQKTYLKTLKRRR